MNWLLSKKHYICCFLAGACLSSLSFLRPPQTITHENVKLVDRVVTKEVVVEKKTELSSKENKANKITITTTTKKDGTQTKVVTILGYQSNGMTLGVDNKQTTLDQTHMTVLTKDTTTTVSTPTFDRFDVGAYWSFQEVNKVTALFNYNVSPVFGVGILTKFSVPVSFGLPIFSVGLVVHF